jgi:CRISPR-associated protein Cmr5
MATLSQRMAQAAFPKVRARKDGHDVNFKEYTTLAKKFPALIHTCGLAQAVAFAQAKQDLAYLDDLASVLAAAGHREITNHETLGNQSRDQNLAGYLRLSRDALLAAGWLKRYVEALAEPE